MSKRTASKKKTLSEFNTTAMIKNQDKLKRNIRKGNKRKKKKHYLHCFVNIFPKITADFPHFLSVKLHQCSSMCGSSGLVWTSSSTTYHIAVAEHHSICFHYTE